MVTRRTLSHWVRISNLKLQFLLLALIVITVGARIVPLEMQKRIVNQAIGKNNLHLLFVYCGMYLGAVVTASSFKYLINVLQTYIGEQGLAKLRKELYAHILSLPVGFYRKASPGMVVSSLTTEVTSVGDFIGQAVSVPTINVLTLISYTAYMFYLNALLALLSMITFPLVIIFIPKLQRRTNTANKARVDITRELSTRIGEAISGIHEIHGNGSYRIENRKYGDFVDQLFRIRLVWTLYKQGIKVLNNLFQSLGPFILFLIGGYLAINGRLNLGALVAFLSTYEKLYDPWKELMDFYQNYQDANVRYKRVMEYFDSEPEHLMEPVGRKPHVLQGMISARNVTFDVAGGIRLLKGISLDLEPGEQLALIGFSGSGKSTFAQCLGQLYRYTGGNIQIDGMEVSELTKRDIVQNMGVVAQIPYIFSGTIKENLVYSCEALLDGNGADESDKLPSLDEIILVLQQTGLFTDVLKFGLNASLHPDQDKALVESIIRCRTGFQTMFGKELADDIEFFDEHRYLYFSTIAANLLFGSPNRPELTLDRLAENDYFLELLNEAQLKGPLVNLGRQLVRQLADIVSDLTPSEIFFKESPVLPQEFEELKAVLQRMEKSSLHEVAEQDQHRLLVVALRFIPGLHKTVAFPKILEDILLEARSFFMTRISKDMPGAITFYHTSDYIFSETILENILFGKQRADRPAANEKINQRIIHLLIEEDLLERIVEIGLHFNVGIRGDRLSGGQRQKLALSRAFLKEPPILILDEATSGLDNASQQRIQHLLETRWKGKSTVVAVVHRLDTIKNYDKVAVMKAGRVVEMGTYEGLMLKKGLLYELVHGAGKGI